MPDRINEVKACAHSSNKLQIVDSLCCMYLKNAYMAQFVFTPWVLSTQLVYRRCTVIILFSICALVRIMTTTSPCETSTTSLGTMATLLACFHFRGFSRSWYRRPGCGGRWRDRTRRTGLWCGTRCRTRAERRKKDDIFILCKLFIGLVQSELKQTNEPV